MHHKLSTKEKIYKCFRTIQHFNSGFNALIRSENLAQYLSFCDLIYFCLFLSLFVIIYLFTYSFQATKDARDRLFEQSTLPSQVGPMDLSFQLHAKTSRGSVCWPLAIEVYRILLSATTSCLTPWCADLCFSSLMIAVLGCSNSVLSELFRGSLPALAQHLLGLAALLAL